MSRQSKGYSLRASASQRRGERAHKAIANKIKNNNFSDEKIKNIIAEIAQQIGGNNV